MEALAQVLQWSGSLTGYWTIQGAFFILAVLEAFVFTTFLLPGTMVFVIAGGLIAYGQLDPLVSAAIYAGTVVGDSLSFLLSGHLQKTKFLARRLRVFDIYRAPLALHPLKFVCLAHLVPYLRGVSAFLAGGALTWVVWFRAELVGALLGTVFLVGLGAAGGLLILEADALGTVGVIAGTAVLAILIAAWMRAFRPCRLAGVAEKRASRASTGRLFRWIIGLVYYFLLWHLVRWTEAALRKLPTRALRRNLTDAFPDVRAGDIFLIRLHASAPWGVWAHTAIVLDSKRFGHGFAKRFSAHRLEILPIRFAIVHLRAKCDDATAAAAATAAARLIGTPVSVWAKPGNASTVSCASAVVHSYACAGFPLWPPEAGRVVPDDLFNHPLVERVRTVFTEQRRAEKGYEGGQGDARELA